MTSANKPKKKPVKAEGLVEQHERWIRENNKRLAAQAQAIRDDPYYPWDHPSFSGRGDSQG